MPSCCRNILRSVRLVTSAADARSSTVVPPHCWPRTYSSAFVMASLVDRDFLVGRLISLYEPVIAALNAFRRPDTRSLRGPFSADIPLLRTSAAALAAL